MNNKPTTHSPANWLQFSPSILYSRLRKARNCAVSQIQIFSFFDFHSENERTVLKVQTGSDISPNVRPHSFWLGNFSRVLHSRDIRPIYHIKQRRNLGMLALCSEGFFDTILAAIGS